MLGFPNVINVVEYGAEEEVEAQPHVVIYAKEKN